VCNCPDSLYKAVLPVKGNPAASDRRGFGMEVRAGHEEAVEEIFSTQGLWAIKLGEVTSAPQLTVTIGEKPLINLNLSALRDAWASGLAKMLS